MLLDLHNKMELIVAYFVFKGFQCYNYIFLHYYIAKYKSYSGY
jgi:hypothetical protein